MPASPMRRQGSARASIRAAVAALAVSLVGALVPLPPAQAAGSITDLVAVDVPAIQWIDIAYGNGRYVAVARSGAGPRSITSTDGVTWVDAGLPSLTWEYVSYCGGRFFASTGATTMYSSTDGTTWTPASGSPAAGSVSCGGGRFAAISGSGDPRGFWSTDGLSWSSATVAPIVWTNASWTEVAYGNGGFVGVSGFPLHTPAKLMTSANGSAWTVQSVPDDGRQWDSITYANGRFVVVSGGTIPNAPSPGGALPVMTSDNGTSWTLRASADDSVLWERVRFEDGRFVAAGSWGGNPRQRIMTSVDGINWSLEPPTSFDARWEAFALAPGQFVGIEGVTSARRIYVSGGGRPTASSDPASWMTVDQALPAAADGTCDGIADGHVAYGTGLTGGWGRSWAAWAGENGGAVCTRTLVNRGTGWRAEPGR